MENFDEMFKYLLNKLFEKKPINKGYRAEDSNKNPDNRPKTMTWLPLNRGI